MNFRTPRFWSRRFSAASLALVPASWLYRLGHAVHQRRVKPYVSSLPVLCVGNLTAGGSGKTPTALAIAGLIRERGLASNPVFLTRGYGGTVAHGEAVFADPAVHTVAEIGDEAFLLAGVAPVIVAPDRARGARLAETMNADLIIMDDGLQNTRLARTVGLLVIDAASGVGNGRLLPAGPLRTPVRQGLARADAIIAVGGPCPVANGGKPVFAARLRTAWRPREDARYLAFCGLGRPEKFFATLEAQGARVSRTETFPDHHAYTMRDLQGLQAHAATDGLQLITTAKDAARIGRDDLSRYAIEVVTVDMSIADEDGLAAFLAQRLRIPA